MPRGAVQRGPMPCAVRSLAILVAAQGGRSPHLERWRGGRRVPSLGASLLCAVFMPWGFSAPTCFKSGLDFTPTIPTPSFSACFGSQRRVRDSSGAPSLLVHPCLGRWRNTSPPSSAASAKLPVTHAWGAQVTGAGHSQSCGVTHLHPRPSACPASDDPLDCPRVDEGGLTFSSIDF